MKWLKSTLKVIVLALVAWGIYRTVDRAIEQLADDGYSWQLHPGWLVLAGLFFLVGMLPMATFWYRGLCALGQHPKLGETLRAFYVGSLGKYVPGKAMVVVLRAGLLRSDRVSTPVAAVSVFLETLTMMAVGAFLSLLMMVVWLNDHLRGHGYLLPLGCGLIILAGLPTLPPVFRRLVVLFGMRRADPEIERRLDGLSARLMLSGWFIISLGWVMLALSLWAVLRAMGIEGVEALAHLPYFIAAVGMAMVAGFVSLIPGGAGVREFVLMLILGHFYFATFLDAPLPDAKALAAAVILRLTWLASELLLCAVLYSAAGRQAAASSVDNECAVSRDVTD